MLTLYYKPTCQFCQKVLGVIESANITVELKDISADTANRAELKEKGGKTQVPYLVDTATDTAMYESDDIIAYLEKQYVTNKVLGPGGVKIHQAGDTCNACEG